MKHLSTIACLFVVAGCSTTVNLYPVEGPFSELIPIPVIQATASVITGNNGEITAILPNGSQCVGEWSSAAASGVTYSQGSLVGTYGETYFRGFSRTSGQGQNPGRAIMNCSDGNQIELEFVTGAGTANGYGIAKDKLGNLYRAQF
jgi:hypothetical protein